MAVTQARETFAALIWMCLWIIVTESSVTSELISSPQPIIVKPGDDVILPCQLKPAVSADSDTIMWSKSGLEPKYVHYHQDGRLAFEKQHQSYYLRTRLFMDELLKGNVSMKIFNVKTSDSGLYTCAVSSVKTSASVQLIVKYELTCSTQPVEGKPEQNVILQASANTPLDHSRVEWTVRRNGEICDVHLYRKGKHELMYQCPDYINKTKIFLEELQRGNASLMLRLHVNHTGTYHVSVKVDEWEDFCQINVTVLPEGSAPPTDTGSQHKSSNNSTTMAVADESAVIFGITISVIGVIGAIAAIVWFKRKQQKKFLANERANQHEEVPLNDSVINRPLNAPPEDQDNQPGEEVPPADPDIELETFGEVRFRR